MMGLRSGASAFWHKEVSLKDFLLNLSILLPHDIDLINPPSWYLIYEVKMFLVMPIMVLLCNKLTWSISYLLVLISCFLYLPVIGCIGSFLFGALLHKLMRLESFNKKIDGLRLILLIFLSLVLLNIRNIYLPLQTISSIPYVTMVQSLGAAILIYIIYVSHGSWIKNKLLLFLGNISYEVYIIHFIILMGIKPFINNYILFLFAAIVLTIVCSVMVYLLNQRISKLLTVNRNRYSIAEISQGFTQKGNN